MATHMIDRIVDANGNEFVFSDSSKAEAGTASPLMDGKASVGNSLKYAREDHVHPTDTSRASASHAHGNIQNGGTLQTNDITIANGDKLVVTDSSDSSKVARASISFDGSTTTKALTQKGTWESFSKSGDITTAIQALDVSSVGGDGKYISAISETDGKISATATTMDTTPTANSTKAVTSGGIKTVLDGKQDSLIAGDNITIDSNTISSNQVFVATYGTTKYAEVKAAYDAGKICTVRNDHTYYYLTQIQSELIWFVAPNPNPNIASVKLTSNNKWEYYSPWLQTHLTFDSAPKAGSKNPVTSDGIKTAIDTIDAKGITINEIAGENVICFE